MRISDWSSDVCSSDLRIVVSSGQIEVASAVSSNPVMLMSPGTSSPLRGATETVAAAMSSLPAKIAVGRSEERRGGKEGVSTCRSRCAPYHYKHKQNEPE